MALSRCIEGRSKDSLTREEAVQTDFIALYRGRTVADARLVAVTAEPAIVGRFTRELAGDANEAGDQPESVGGEPSRVIRGDEE